jgi:hypothetical protein
LYRAEKQKSNDEKLSLLVAALQSISSVTEHESKKQLTILNANVFGEISLLAHKCLNNNPELAKRFLGVALKITQQLDDAVEVHKKLADVERKEETARKLREKKEQTKAPIITVTKKDDDSFDDGWPDDDDEPKKEEPKPAPKKDDDSFDEGWPDDDDEEPKKKEEPKPVLAPVKTDVDSFDEGWPDDDDEPKKPVEQPKEEPKKKDDDSFDEGWPDDDTEPVKKPSEDRVLLQLATKSALSTSSDDGWPQDSPRVTTTTQLKKFADDEESAGWDDDDEPQVKQKSNSLFAGLLEEEEEHDALLEEIFSTEYRLLDTIETPAENDGRDVQIPKLFSMTMPSGKKHFSTKKDMKTWLKTIVTKPAIQSTFGPNIQKEDMIMSNHHGHTRPFPKVTIFLILFNILVFYQLG